MLFSTEKARSLLAAALLPACTAFLAGALTLPASGEALAGLVSGTTRDSTTGKPLAEVQINARNLDKGTDRAAVTNTDGVFTFTNLEPGRYEVAATKNGFQKSSLRVEVVAQQTVQVGLALQADIAPLTDREKNLLGRIERLEERLAAMEARDASSTQAANNGVERNLPLVASATPIPAAFADPMAQVGKPTIPRPTHASRSPRTYYSGGASSSRVHSGGRQFYPVRIWRLYLAQRHSAQQRHCAGDEILHA